jgi:protein phosphatase
MAVMVMVVCGLLCLLLVAVVVAVKAARRPPPAQTPERMANTQVAQKVQIGTALQPLTAGKPLPSFVSVPPPSGGPDGGNDSLTQMRPIPDSEDGGRRDVSLIHFETGAEVASGETIPDQERIWTASAGLTDRGITRARNEDAYMIEPDLDLYVVADGMGGYAKGDVASRLAVQEVASALRDPSRAKDTDVSCPLPGRQLLAAVDRANVVVHAEASREGKGIIGSTLLAARFSRREQRVYIANVGDSRCYRLREGKLKLLTTDHTHAARGTIDEEENPNDLYRAVGVSPEVEIDLIVDRPLQGDRYLLCTDGLSRTVSDSELTDILSKQMNLDRISSLLVLAANGKGGRDNVTVITVDVNRVDAAASA